jgi:hypothetical protein
LFVALTTVAVILSSKLGANGGFEHITEMAMDEASDGVEEEGPSPRISVKDAEEGTGDLQSLRIMVRRQP